jgi:hypothetical protein
MHVAIFTVFIIQTPRANPFFTLLEACWLLAFFCVVIGDPFTVGFLCGSFREPHTIEDLKNLVVLYLRSAAETILLFLLLNRTAFNCVF